MNSKLRHRDFTELFCILLCESADFCNVNCIENMCVREWVQKKKKKGRTCVFACLMGWFHANVVRFFFFSLSNCLLNSKKMKKGKILFWSVMPLQPILFLSTTPHVDHVYVEYCERVRKYFNRLLMVQSCWIQLFSVHIRGLSNLV